MKKLAIRQRLKGLFLLVTYLLILTASSLHFHECRQETYVCQDCVEHVKHNAHISQASVLTADCVLCQVLHADYLTPEVLLPSAVALLVFAFVAMRPQHAVCRMTTLPTLRAPPVR